jgi:LuxR family quorum-sensing system transcriptional regulator CciR
VPLTASNLSKLLDRFSAVKTADALHELLEAVTRSLGFSQFALGHHVDITLPTADAIRLTSYDPAWIEHIIERGYFADDPIHLASTKTAGGFAWSEVSTIIRLTARHKQVLTDAVGFGLSAGFTVPIHVPGEYQGTCSFAAESQGRLHEYAYPVAQLCGTFAFEAARRIMRSEQGLLAREIPDLTRRQRDALVLVGRGKTDREIGELLGVSTSTAHEHVEGVRRAYGNAQRAYLIVRALFDGQVAFADLLRR